METDQKLTLLRAEMAAAGIDAYIVSNADPHHNENVAERWRCRTWLSGMSGSSGTVVVTAHWAGLWTDSRYYEAGEIALKDCEIELIRISDIGVDPIDVWLKSHLTEGQTVGFHGADTELKQARNWVKTFELSKLQTRTDIDLIDLIWKDRPVAPKGELFLVDESYAGQSIQSKIDTVREKMQSSGIEAYLLGRTDESCWLLNFRGTDIADCPTPYCYTLITADTVYFYIDSEKLTSEAIEIFTNAEVTIKAYNAVEEDLKKLDASSRILIAPNYINYQLAEAVKHCLAIESRPIVTDLKAIKNKTEVSHLKQALIDDAAAMVKFFTWLYASIERGDKVTELSASRTLESYRASFESFRHISFESIMGYGSNGAIVHYAVNEESDREILTDNIFLIDSGGNYLHGTTDTTRTIPMGKPNQEQKEDYTAVLHGMLDLLTLEFVEGSTGAQLDGVCRQALWKHGKNFKHGTGHGVGFGLEVHEGPQGISGMNTEIMKLGMITTVEPGCYRPGKHGIRIENMVHTVLSRETEFGRFFKFENLTFCPINTDLIDRERLPQQHIDWLNDYHSEILEKLTPKLNEAEITWLKHACRAI